MMIPVGNPKNVVVVADPVNPIVKEIEKNEKYPIAQISLR